MVKRYVTTCDCMSQAAWGDYVRYDDYAALEAELARLRAGQEPVATVKESQYLLGDTSDEISELLPIGTKLYTTPQPSAVPDAITMADVMRAWEYAEDHPHKYLRGTTNWCAAVAHSLNQQRVAAPSVPKADDPVKVQLLEALEAILPFIPNTSAAEGGQHDSAQTWQPQTRCVPPSPQHGKETGNEPASRCSV